MSDCYLVGRQRTLCHLTAAALGIGLSSEEDTTNLRATIMFSIEGKSDEMLEFCDSYRPILSQKQCRGPFAPAA